MSAGARAAGTLAQRAAGERAARRTACLVVPATLCALVGVLQQRQHERHTAEMERLQGALLAELVASEDKRERVLALAPQLAASAGARSADCTSLAAALRELDLLRRLQVRPRRLGICCISELIKPVTVSSQSTCKDAIQPLQGFSMHHTITS